MVPSDPTQTTTVALLSAASLSLGAGSATATGLIGGQSVLEYQIKCLQQSKVRRFMVEVDQVSGTLLQIADKAQKYGLSVEFVRSGADIQRVLQASDRLWVQSEALYVAPDMIDQLLGRTESFIATLDGRDENAAFERIDINTRWSGIAVVDAKTAYALENLPEGWSMTSSILRQALQEKVAFLALPQQYLQNNDLKMLANARDVSDLNTKILRDQVGGFRGAIEAKIFAPLATRIAPAMWRMSFGSPVLRWAGAVVAGGSLALAIADFSMAAIALAVVALMFNVLRRTTGGAGSDNSDFQAASIITWVFLAMAVLAAAWSDARNAGDDIPTGVMVVGLALLSHRLALPAGAGLVLKSPALLAIIAFAATPLIGFAQTMQWVAIAQLGGLIAASWMEKPPEKKA